MRPRSPDFLIAGLALLGEAVAWGLFLVARDGPFFRLWRRSARGAHRLEPRAPRAAPERAGTVVVIETYAIQLANRRRIDGLYDPRRLAHTVRAFGFALLAIGVYMLVRQQI